mgnify:CR=1 FL=1
MDDQLSVNANLPDKPKENELVTNERQKSVLRAVTGNEWKKYTRVGMAALGGLPWVGSVISAAATLSAENEQGVTNQLLYLWVKEHEGKLKEFGTTLNLLFGRFESFGDQIKERIESDEYITLVRKTFRLWDQAETLEKREMLRKVIANAGGLTIAQDDLIRMFLEWINKYHEFHFAVIREVQKAGADGITRAEIWSRIRGERPQDNSSEANLFTLLISDLSLGEVITQFREVNSEGQRMRQKGQKRSSSSTMQSPFEDTKPYVLTGLGTEFVHYVMEELVPQIEKAKE